MSRELPDVSSAQSLESDLFAGLRVQVSGYRLVGILGRGGQATVYKAIDLRDGEAVAIKIRHGGPLADTDARLRFEREIIAIKALKHPNIVGHRASGQTAAGHDYLVMNFIDGQRLDEYLWKSETGKPLDLEARLQLFMKVCTAVGAAHRAGITHRDLSPSNIRVDPQGEPHILDFGLARTAFDDLFAGRHDPLTLTHQFVGKLGYASPEQVGGKEVPVDIRSDVYSLGVILYQILAEGQFPYEVHGSMAEVLENILHKVPQTPVPTRLVARADGLCQKAGQVALRALRKKPDDRPQSAGELGQEVNSLLALLPPEARRSKGPGSVARRRLLVVGGWSLVLVCAAVTLLLFDLPRGGPSYLHLDSSTGKSEAASAAPVKLSPTEPLPGSITNSMGMKFVRIQPGEFIMGTPPTEPNHRPNEGPQHKVRIAKPFFMQACLVTRGQFAQFVNDTHYQTDAERSSGIDTPNGKGGWKTDRNGSWRNPGFAQTDDHPVVCMSWNDAVAFSTWLSSRESKTYRLPTEAEWEYSCRAGTQTAYFWGDDPNGGAEYANLGDKAMEVLGFVPSTFTFNDAYTYTSPVGSFKPNPWGLYDMIGNANQYCLDFAGSYSVADAVDPVNMQSPGGLNPVHIFRGGGWYGSARGSRSGARAQYAANNGTATGQGFRLVMESSAGR